MNTVLRPAGPLPARVYWVRRGVLVGVVVLLVLLLTTVVQLVRGPGADGTAAAAAASGRTAADGAEEASQEDAPQDDAGDGEAGAASAAEGEEKDASGAPQDCVPTDLTATLSADAEAYPAGTDPTFSLTLTNTSQRACTVDAGLANQSLVVTSGSDRIWSSADCTAPEGERLLLLAPGAQEVMPVAWPRVRSDEACTPDLPEPKAGTYTAVGQVAGVQSGALVFGLG